MNRTIRTLIIGIGLGLAVSPASASSLTYTPVNPTFGGNPLNGSFLLSTAQAQGKGASSGQNSPDLSGLNAALAGIANGAGGGGSPIVIVQPGGTPASP